MRRALFILPLLFAGNAGALDIACPAQVAVTTQPREVPAGWEGVVPAAPHNFERVSIYYRHPREMGSQVPDNEGSKQPPHWSFAGENSGDYWVACEYFGTATLLARQLPAGLTRCSATTKGLRCQ